MPSILPTLFLRPLRVVGIPVAFAILRFAVVMPSARFQLKLKPGIIDFFAIKNTPSFLCYATIIILFV